MRSTKPRAPRQVGLTFADELALAILAGAKTETRRPLFCSPKVRAGDELYARLTFSIGEEGESIFRFQYRQELTEEEVAQVCRWTPAIHMPKERAPFFLPLVEVVEENLHDITEAGAKAEGAHEMFRIEGADDAAQWVRGGATPKSTHLNGFRSIWDDLYKGTPNAWENNPRVRVYRWKEVRRC